MVYDSFPDCWTELISREMYSEVNAGEGMEKREPSYTVGGNAKYSHYGE